jgi:ferredoxin
MSRPRFEVEGYDPVEVHDGHTMLELCVEADIPMETACGGFAACNSCRVLVLEGGDNISPIEPEEAAFLDAPGQRLGCQAAPTGSVVVRLDPGM